MLHPPSHWPKPQALRASSQACAGRGGAARRGTTGPACFCRARAQAADELPAEAAAQAVATMAEALQQEQAAARACMTRGDSRDGFAKPKPSHRHQFGCFQVCGAPEQLLCPFNGDSRDEVGGRGGGGMVVVAEACVLY